VVAPWRERWRTLRCLTARGLPRTASRHLLAAIRVLSRLQRGAETLRAARHERATVGPDWLQTLVPLAWSGRYGKQLEDPRLPRAQAACDA
jgi:hypothetical protein